MAVDLKLKIETRQTLPLFELYAHQNMLKHVEIFWLQHRPNALELQDCTL